jgi:hypothetical protein
VLLSPLSSAADVDDAWCCPVLLLLSPLLYCCCCDDGGVHVSHFASGKEISDLMQSVNPHIDCQVAGMRRVSDIMRKGNSHKNPVCEAFIMNESNPSVESIVSRASTISHWVVVVVVRTHEADTFRVIVIDTYSASAIEVTAFFGYCKQQLRLTSELWHMPREHTQLSCTCGYQAVAVMTSISPFMRASVNPEDSIERLFQLQHENAALLEDVEEVTNDQFTQEMECAPLDD